MMMTEEMRVKKAHIAMMRHPETALYSAVMMMGTSEVIDDAITAYTDGVNKRYGRGFLKSVCKTDAEVAGLVLHENLHIALRHMLHNRDLFKEDRSLANKAADYVVNAMIMEIKDKSLVKLPEGGLYDEKYKNMSMREVYRLLKQEQEPQSNDSEGGEGEDSGYSFDDHDIDGMPDADDPNKAREMNDRIDRALREGALLAGRLGMDIPRSISALLDIEVDWRKELAEFVSAATKGKDEYTWRRFNRRYLANDLLVPSVENETIGEVVIAIDTSGSITQGMIDTFAGELVSLCEAMSPEALRVLWWDTKVHGEQKFTDDYSMLPQMLKPQGGGGTRVGCVSEYINKHNIRAECVVVFTDGCVEDKPVWGVSAPTLWLVTHNQNFVPPAGGRKVKFNK